ncbi:MAG TPA: hypothetical protein VM121_07130 [Acidimicrobiales bacterium]|nr:hypothetical protein [Acidimicrobiales bacterium]
MLTPAEERRHPPGPGADWEESWYFDFVVPGGSFGGFLRLGLRPAEGRAWWWTCLVGDRRPLVSVRDHDIDLPSGRTLEVRASGLWGEITTETPLEHWSVGLEAFGVALDDPEEAWRGERGDRVAVGFDLEWEATHATARSLDQPGDGYAQPCAVHGDVLLGDERLMINAWGWRSHAWGDGGALPTASGMAFAGHLADGTPVTSRDQDLHVASSTRAPVLVTAADGSVSHLDRALCRFEAADGREGSGWHEQGVSED